MAYPSNNYNTGGGPFRGDRRPAGKLVYVQHVGGIDMHAGRRDIDDLKREFGNQFLRHLEASMRIAVMQSPQRHGFDIEVYMPSHIELPHLYQSEESMMNRTREFKRTQHTTKKKIEVVEPPTKTFYPRLKREIEEWVKS